MNPSGRKARARGVDPARTENAVEATSRRSYETFPHGADIGVRGRGPTLAAAFEGAGIALTSVVTNPANVRAVEAIEIRCHAGDAEMLLFEWLNALVYEMGTRRMLFARYEVTIDGDELHARAFGEPVDRTRHQPTVEVKGATCTELRVRRDGDGWLAQCVVDV